MTGGGAAPTSVARLRRPWPETRGGGREEGAVGSLTVGAARPCPVAPVSSIRNLPKRLPSRTKGGNLAAFADAGSFVTGRRRRPISLEDTIGPAFSALYAPASFRPFPGGTLACGPPPHGIAHPAVLLQRKDLPGLEVRGHGPHRRYGICNAKDLDGAVSLSIDEAFQKRPCLQYVLFETLIL